jgi:hypothetical protein
MVETKSVPMLSFLNIGLMGYAGRLICFFSLMAMQRPPMALTLRNASALD